MKKDFIPKSNSNLNSFVRNFLTRLDIHTEDLAMNEAEVEEAKRVLKNHMKTFANMISIRAQSKAATEEFNASKEKTIDIVRRISGLIKSSKKYQRDIGYDFGIINRYEPVTDFSLHKPVLKIKVTGSDVRINYTANSADAIQLYSKRGNESKFTELATVFKRTYTDKRPNLLPSKPEAREYYAVYFVNYKLCGMESDVVKVTVP